MKSSVVAAIASAVLLALAGPASAQVPGPGAPGSSNAYLVARVGAFVPQGSDLKDYNFGTGIDFEVGAGMQFTPVLAGEFAIGRFATSGTGTLSYPDGTGWTVADFDGDLEVVSFTATLKAFIPMQGPLKVYGLAGVGVYSADLSGTSNWVWTDGVFTDAGQDTISASNSPFGLHLGAGFAFPVSPQVHLGLEAKYAMVSPKFYGETFEASGFRVGGALAFQF
jgi:opacity protein-like surface antigen